jgi:aminotransferase
MRPPPERLERLPEQYFTRLLARVSAAAAAVNGEPLVDLGRGNPDIPPPVHVAAALTEAAARPDTHGYPPFAGLPALKEAIAARYRDVYDVAVDPEREVAVLPGSKTGLIEFAQVTAERGASVVLPDPGYPDYRSAVAMAGGRHVALPLLHDGRPDWDAAPDDAAALYLNYPSNPVAACAPAGVFEETVAWAQRTGTWVLHDFAYGDLVFDGRRPRSFLTTDGAREVGLELFSMSKSYGMAGWRLGFAIGNAELIARIEDLQNHVFAGVFMPVQHAGIAALTGPQETVEERRALYEARRDRVLAALPGVEAQCEGTFFVWFRLPEGVTCEGLLEEQRVAVAPGEGFGSRGAGWARLSLASPDDRIDLGLARLAAVLQAS